MAQTKQKTKLYKALYNAARRCIDSAYRNNPEAVKALRDQTCEEMFGRPYRELTKSELIDAINELDVVSGKENPTNIKKPAASDRQLKMLRFYALYCAIRYFDFDGYKYQDSETGEIYKGERLRMHIRYLFDIGTWLPPNIWRHLFQDWINPRAQKFLVEGGFKKFYKNAHSLYYEHLTPDEAQYLLQRFKQIYTNLPKRSYINEVTRISKVN